MKILILFDLHRAPKVDEEFSPAALRKEEDKPTEADVLECLARLGHETETLAVFDNVVAIVEKLKAFAPDVVFNLTESFHAQRSNEPNIPALLELLKVRYTGAGPDALLLCKDKSLAKKLLSYHRVRVARFVVSPAASAAQAAQALRLSRVRQAGRRGVVGRDRAGVVRARRGRGARAGQVPARALRGRRDDRGVHRGARAVRERHGQQAADGVAGARAVLREAARRRAEVRHAKAKWDDAYRKKWGIKNGPAAELDPKVSTQARSGGAHDLSRAEDSRARAHRRAADAGGRGRSSSRPIPNPSLAREDDFAQSAAMAGTDYDTLIQKILDVATA